MLGRGMGIGGAVIALILSLVFGVNIFDNGGGSPVPQQTAPGAAQQPVNSSPKEDERIQFVSFVLDDVQNTWTREFQQIGREYEHARLVLFTDATRSGCGFAESAAGPFYCPADSKVYIDLGFYNELRSRELVVRLLTM